MKLVEKATEQVRDGFLAELTDAALETASRHGVGGPSVEQELDLWHVFNVTLRRRPAPCLDGVVPANVRWDNFLADLTDAAYQEALRHGFRDSFLDVRMDMWQALRRVFWEGRFAGRFFRATCA
jgi:hypothetical protein